MSNILVFPAADERASGRLVTIMDGRVSANDLAASLGSPGDWVSTAVVYLKTECTSDLGELEGMALVSRAALQVVLGYIENLEGLIGHTSDPKGAA